ncbi:MAG: sugar transferase [Anaerolineaceae bacterium]|nr:sugar transferase [Anaerolineaceae bacterium]
MDLNLEIPLIKSDSRSYKRFLDIVGAAIGILICLPVSILIGLLIKLESPGPVIYRQERIGKGGKRFVMYKFRTMCEASTNLDRDALSDNPDLSANFERFQKLVDDPRLTQVGKLLRRSSLDEIPQFWNTLKGDMSLIGPRPFLVEQIDIYGDAYCDYIQVCPGMTGLWQVSGRNRLSFQERAQLDVYYVRNQSLWLDLIILIKTIVVVLAQDGAY